MAHGIRLVMLTTTRSKRFFFPFFSLLFFICTNVSISSGFLVFFGWFVKENETKAMHQKLQMANAFASHMNHRSSHTRHSTCIIKICFDASAKHIHDQLFSNLSAEKMSLVSPIFSRSRLCLELASNELLHNTNARSFRHRHSIGQKKKKQNKIKTKRNSKPNFRNAYQCVGPESVFRGLDAAENVQSDEKFKMEKKTKTTHDIVTICLLLRMRRDEEMTEPREEKQNKGETNPE